MESNYQQSQQINQFQQQQSQQQQSIQQQFPGQQQDMIPQQQQMFEQGGNLNPQFNNPNENLMRYMSAPQMQHQQPQMFNPMMFGNMNMPIHGYQPGMGAWPNSQPQQQLQQQSPFDFMAMQNQFKQMQMGYNQQPFQQQNQPWQNKGNYFGQRQQQYTQCEQQLHQMIEDEEYHNHDKENNADFNFKTVFNHAIDYRIPLKEITEFPHFATLNDPTQPTKAELANAKYYMIRSTNEDDLHKAIKYNIWTSSQKNNHTLMQIWKECTDQQQPIPIYLFFSVVKSKKLYGAARMIQDIKVSESFKYWWEGAKFFGLCKLKWLFVKDLPVEDIQDITEKDTSKEVPVTECYDTQQISQKNGKLLFKKFKQIASQSDSPSILLNFAKYDRREDCLRRARDNDQIFIQMFNNKAQKYCDDPLQYQNFKKKPSQQNFQNQGSQQHNYQPQQHKAMSFPLNSSSSGSNQQQRPNKAQYQQQTTPVVGVSGGGKGAGQKDAQKKPQRGGQDFRQFQEHKEYFAKDKDISTNQPVQERFFIKETKQQSQKDKKKQLKQKSKEHEKDQDVMKGGFEKEGQAKAIMNQSDSEEEGEGDNAEGKALKAIPENANLKNLLKREQESDQEDDDNADD